MKFISTLLIGTLLAVTGNMAFAASSSGNSATGTWTLNIEKSKFSGPSFKSQTRTYAEAADGTITMTFNGVASDGAAVSGGSTYKTDGKDYSITGSGDFDTVSVKKVNGTTVKFALKKADKAVGTGTRTLSAHGKVITVTAKVKGAGGHSYTSMMVFDRQ